MLKFYQTTYITYHNNTKIATHYSKALTATPPADDIITITWDNLSEIMYKYGIILPFNIWNFKKGRRLSFFSDSLFNKDCRDIKEWKQPNLNITIIIKHRDISDQVRLSEVLQWYEPQKAIQYLKERGLKISL